MRVLTVLAHIISVSIFPNRSSANADMEEKKVITMNENKYSTSKPSRSGAKLEENSSDEFEQADKDQFKTYDEYNEEEYTFEAFEEVLVYEEGQSKWSAVENYHSKRVSDSS